MKELNLEAKKENVELISGFVEETLEELECPMKVSVKLMIAVDEIISNIVNYSGAKTMGIQIEMKEGEATLKLKDDGSEYNPLQREDPDVTLKAEEREIGGLGIFMVKKSMDEVEYEYTDDKNVLTLKIHTT